jgi:hypothetical protein
MLWGSGVVIRWGMSLDGREDRPMYRLPLHESEIYVYEFGEIMMH